ncbi:MAG: GH3 auxin-responsive promoter family protein [Candidatus Omnitrophica bacterium]|nr:GH3 auxin-responsive promoter family protein [Candidatus Omnitrophota bacterium]
MIEKILGSVFCSYAQKRFRQIQETYTSPLDLQERNLKKILQKSKETVFGRKFDFKSIKSIADYQKRIPLTSYEKMKPWVDGCLEGKPDYIWPGRIKYFALTSGTTSGSSKYIPVSSDVIRENKKAALDSILFYLANTKDRSLFNGKILFLGGSTSLKSMPNGLRAGDMSGILSKFTPFYISSCQEPRRDLIILSDWEEKVKRVIEDVRKKDVRLICGLPPWLLVFFDHLLEREGKRHVSEIWPNLSLFIYGGLDFSPYRKLMKDIIGKDIYYMETYFASEAFMGIQDIPSSEDAHERGILLMLDYGIFYEFIEAEDVTKDNPRRYTVSDVKTDVNYAIAVTNVNGLYSYLIGDTVKFVSRAPLRIRVTGRIEDFLSVAGEHVIDEEIEYAISQAVLRQGGIVSNYTVAPYYPPHKKGRPGHQWLIEFLELPQDLNKFAEAIDRVLCDKNDDYREHRRRDFCMSAPSIYKLKEGTFYKWHKKRDQLGGQHKTPHLRNNRSIAKELIELDSGL